MADPVNQTVAQAATEQDALPMDNLQLIGIYAGPDFARVLLRGSDGAVVSATAGDETPLGRVTHISDTFALIDTGTRIRRLTLLG